MLPPKTGGKQFLHPEHLADLRASGLSDEQIRDCGFYTETDPSAVAKLLNWKRPATDLGPCLCIPFHGTDGKPSGYTRVKPSKPRQKDGKTVKYESPVGKPNRAYIPPATRAKLADPTITLIVTEGEKKTCAADQHGLASLGLVGVYGWVAKRGTDTDGRQIGERELIPDLAAIPWTDRAVYIVYDSDAETNANVRQAELHLAEALQARGADVRVVRLPTGKDGAKVGLDDYLLAHNATDLHHLMFAAKPPAKTATVPAAPVRQLTSPPWPELQPEALHGLVGRFVRALEPHTEASIAALLFQFLAFAGNRFGRTAHYVVEGTRHYCNEFACIVGDTARARKGTSLGRVQTFFETVDPAWVGGNITSGLSSGEGLIHRVRDRVVNEDPDPDHDDPVVLDEGVQDKRVLVVEEEFAKVLKQADRQGNILSDTMRNVWDGKPLSALTKNAPAKATGAHISVVAHITKHELRRTLSATDQSNGFGNRFLWVCSRRSQLLPDGGNPDHKVLAELRCELAAAFAFADGAGEITRDANAKALWHDVYMALNQSHRSGIVDALLARDTAHIVRLSMMYAVLDKSAVVRVEHLGAAVAAWGYCEDSVAHLFGSSTGNPTADKLLLFLQNSPNGATRTAIRELVGGRVSGADLDAALALLNNMRLARPEERATAGRPSEVWTATANGGAARG